MSFANALGLEIARVTGLAATVEELPATSDDGERLVTVTFPAVKLMTAIKLLSLFRQGALPTAVRYFGFDMHGRQL